MASDEKSDDLKQDIKAITEKILNDTSGIIDRQQRTYAIGKKLKLLTPETILEILCVIARRARLKEPLYQDGFRTVSDIRRISKHIGFGKMSEVYTLARRKNYTEVLAFMKMVPPARQLGADEELEEDPVLLEMTLGTKRQKARMRDRDLINRLCHEQDPLVIQNLLKNPVVTLQHVIKIASKRPTSAQILWVVYRDLKWINHYMVKKALINNPYTPTQISLSLLHFLLEQDLEEVSESMLLHPQVKQTAVELIMIKREGADNGSEGDG
jgi:hypothetical protein